MINLTKVVREYPVSEYPEEQNILTLAQWNEATTQTRQAWIELGYTIREEDLPALEQQIANGGSND